MRVVVFRGPDPLQVRNMSQQAITVRDVPAHLPESPVPLRGRYRHGHHYRLYNRRRHAHCVLLQSYRQGLESDLAWEVRGFENHLV
jgi:hypothetical protein